MDAALYEKLYRQEERHWWFRARRKIVLALLRRFLGPSRPDGSALRVCDVGCGTGLMLQDLAQAGYHAVGFDPSQDALGYCRTRGVTVEHGFLPDGIPAPFRDFDAVLLMDVLEHIDEDGASLRQAAACVRNGGVVICTVPAYPWLWTQRDTNQHHRRRYSHSEFRRLLACCDGARPVFLSHMNALLLPLAVVVRWIDRLWPAKHRGFGDLAIPPLGFNRLFEACFAGETPLLGRGVRLPFGLSLVAVLRRCDGTH